MTERKSAEERTASLLAAAEAILDRRRRITVSEITREAGIASGTFYLYFPSKAHLEATLIERFVDGYVAAVEQAVADGAGLLDRLEGAVGALVRYPLEHLAVFRLQVTHTPTTATREIIAGGIDRLKAVLADSLSEGTARDEASLDDPEMTASLLFHGVEGMLRDSVAFGRELDEDRVLRGAASLLQGLLAPKTARDAVS